MLPNASSPELPTSAAPETADAQVCRATEVDPRLAPFYRLQQLRLDLQSMLVTHPLGFKAFTEWNAKEELKCKANPERVRRPALPIAMMQELVVNFQREAESLCAILDENGNPLQASDLLEAECQANNWMSPGEFAAWFKELRCRWNELCQVRAKIVEDNIPLAKNFLRRAGSPQRLAEDFLGELLLALNVCVDNFVPGSFAFATYAYWFFGKVRLNFFNHNPLETYLDGDIALTDLAGIPDNTAVENDRHEFFKDLITDALSRLDDRSRLIVTFRYGLDGEPPWTLEEIGELAGRTRERIRQIEEQAMKTLTAHFVSEGKGGEIIRGLGEC